MNILSPLGKNVTMRVVCMLPQEHNACFPCPDELRPTDPVFCEWEQYGLIYCAWIPRSIIEKVKDD